jgi:aminopeptidase
MTEYSAPVRPDDEVVIRGSTLAEPLLLELYRATLEREGIPWLLMSSPLEAEYLYRYSSVEGLDRLSDLQRSLVERADVIFGVMSEKNTRAMSEVEPAKMARRSRAHRELGEIHARRAAEGDLLWSVTLYPTSAYAQDAEMSTMDYSEFVLEACLLNEDDPVARWQDLSQRQQILVDHLDQAQEIHVKSAGTDLRLGITGRVWQNSDGKRNFPSGEVFTGPVENQVNGTIAFAFPAVYRGREVRGVRLMFEQGKVVAASAEHNEGFLLEMLETDEGARYLGEVAFGTNNCIQRFMRNTLFDEKIGGTMHFALGRSYPETGGLNKSAIHWDLVCDLRDESEVWVDGELFQRNGRFEMLDGGVV